MPVPALMPDHPGTTTLPSPASVDVEEFFADADLARPAISPDGTRIAYLAPHRGRRNVWVRGVEQDHADAVPVTHDTRRGITSHYWTDDPRWLLYLQDTDGNEDWHLYRVDLDDPAAPAVDLTPLDPGSRVFAVDPETAQPGAVIAWMNRRPLFVDVFRIEVATGRTTTVLERADPAETFVLDRRGRATWFMAQDADGAHEIHAADPDTGATRLVHRVGGSEHPMGIFLLPTPDGRAALIGDYQDSDDLRLVRIDHDTGERTVVAAVEGHSLDTSSAVSDTLPPTVFASRAPGRSSPPASPGTGPVWWPSIPGSPRCRRPWSSSPTGCWTPWTPTWTNSAGSPRSSTTGSRRPGSTTTPPARPASCTAVTPSIRPGSPRCARSPSRPATACRCTGT